MRHLPNPAHARGLGTAELRDAFLVDGLFVPGTIQLQTVDLDRVAIAGAVPTDRPLALEAPGELAAAFFAERREIGILNIGAPGTATVDGTRHPVATRDVLYVGRGSRDVQLASDDPATPARFYIVSYPAHAAYPTTLVTRARAQTTELGTMERANRRRLAKYVHGDGARSAQLVMGVTELLDGSVWNTMPAHTHVRRTEIYLYFDLPADAVVVHLMGEPDETRHLVVRDGQVVLSPAWSIHAGCGTTKYAFCWAMGGENQDFADMQMVALETLR